MQISISCFKLFSDKSVKPHNADMYVLLIKVRPCRFEITYNLKRESYAILQILLCQCSENNNSNYNCKNKKYFFNVFRK